MIDFSTPLAGIQKAQASLDRTAAKLAGFGNSQGDSVDLSAAAIALIQARNSVKANVSVIHTQDEISQSLLDILA